MRFKFPLRIRMFLLGIGGGKPESMYGEKLLRFLADFLKKRLKENPHTMQELGEEAFASMQSPNNARMGTYILLRVWQRKGGVDISDGGLVTWRRNVPVKLDRLANVNWRFILENWETPGYKEQIETILKGV